MLDMGVPSRELDPIDSPISGEPLLSTVPPGLMNPIPARAASSIGRDFVRSGIFGLRFLSGISSEIDLFFSVASRNFVRTYLPNLLSAFGVPA
jgi:hypothetical protein